MEIAGTLARLGNRILSIIAAIMILLMLLYGGYSLWDTVMVYRGAFLSSDLLQFKPAEDAVESPTLLELKAINPDVQGWLTIDDTHIDYPVVQGENDMEYVNKDVYGEFALSGAIFLSSLDNLEFDEGYHLLYGHHMDNGGMFGDIVEFSQESYFEDHTSGVFYLPDAAYDITLFACLEVDAYDPVVYDCDSGADRKKLLDYIKKNAVQYREIGVTAADSVMGFSTCAEAETNGRVVVFGRLTKRS